MHIHLPNLPSVIPSLLLLLLTCLPAGAQTERTGSADARVMQQLQQVSSERAALQSENARLKQEVEQLRKDFERTSAANKALENKTSALSASAGREQAAGKQAAEQLERNREQMQELVTKFRETAQNLREAETDRASIKSELTNRERELKVCVDRNAGLYNLSTEVLDRLENRGFFSSLGEREPFTKIKRVQLENLIDDYKYRAEELRLEQKQASAGKQDGQ